MDFDTRTGAQPRHKRVVTSRGQVLLSDSTESELGAADFIAPVDANLALVEDFLGDAGDSIPVPFVVASTETGGTPVKDFLNGAFGGQLKLAGDTTSEAQTVRVDFGDNLILDSSKNPVMEARIKIQFNGSDTEMTADERFVVGFAGPHNATLDDIARNAWFRVEGANLNLLIESDDGTTDDDDNDTGTDIADDTWIVLRVDCSDLGTIRFFADGVQVGELAASAMSGGLQPLIEYQKDAGAEAQVLLVDYIKIWCGR